MANKPIPWIAHPPSDKLREMLDYFREIGDWRGIQFCLMMLAAPKEQKDE